MSPAVVLDADGLDALSQSHPPERLRALLTEAWKRRSEVLVAAVTCAESCRGAARTRSIESALSRRSQPAGSQAAVQVVPTDFDLARTVGAVLHGAGAGTVDIVDAHAVALAVSRGGGIVITADPDDIDRLASAAPAVRVVSRPAR